MTGLKATGPFYHPPSAASRVPAIGVPIVVSAILACPQLTLPTKYVLAEVGNTTTGDIMVKYSFSTESVDVGPVVFPEMFTG